MARHEWLVRVDKNGTEIWATDTCQRCGGQGGRDEWAYTGRVCYECGGSGHSKVRTWKVYTPEYEAKLAERRAKREAARQAKWEAEHAEEIAAKKAKEEAERLEREAREKAEAERKARSKYYNCEVGDRITVDAVYEGSPYFERRPFGAWPGSYEMERVYIHRFRVGDALLIWKSTSFGGMVALGVEEGDKVSITGTVKELTEYNGEKQTVLQRCKVKGVPA